MFCSSTKVQTVLPTVDDDAVQRAVEDVAAAVAHQEAEPQVQHFMTHDLGHRESVFELWDFPIFIGFLIPNFLSLLAELLAAPRIRAARARGQGGPQRLLHALLCRHRPHGGRLCGRGRGQVADIALAARPGLH